MLTQLDPLHEAAAAWLEDLQELRIMLSQRIEQWADAVLDASSLADVLGPPPADH